MSGEQRTKFYELNLHLVHFAQYCKGFTWCWLGPMNEHLETYGLMDGAQRGARAGVSGTIENLLIDRMVTLACHWRKRNLSMDQRQEGV